MSATAAGVIIERRELPPIPAPDRRRWTPPYAAFDGINQCDTYAAIRCGDIHAEIVRFAYWHPNDGVDTVDVSFDARLHVPDEGAGIADIQLDDSHKLYYVGQVATRAAFLLDEARRRHSTVLLQNTVDGGEGSAR
ncbi:hypothetical protein [Mycobacterium sp. 852002-51057_SCH5723018]|uniref:hypothetical protein n=1 Tax=Mycobacterium sp. 852002-51057_SCH5723018 TaxID=1834094 RepID=UPI0007FD57FE|nr:hypothetical protein [Mycobacterium sp. 852002-51057_SCH5723018]OBG25292.1 hypothetical protein A5764_07890 [Mycobacterium sp. 852002-51057_SCH5723018]